MKKITLTLTLILPLISVLLMLFGCTDSKNVRDPFSVFHGDTSAEITVRLGESESTVSYVKTGDVTAISFLSPSALNGFSFTVEGDNAVLSGGEIQLPASGALGLLPRLLSAVFSEEKENITEITTEKSDGGILTVIRTPSATYRFAVDGTPVSAEGIFGGMAFNTCFNAFFSAEEKP